MVLNTVEELLEDIRQGKMVILMDDEDRENEGDLVMAAPMVRPQDVNFMATYARGLICLTLNEQRCKQLELGMMVEGDSNKSSHSTPFTCLLRPPRVLPPASLPLTARAQCRPPLPAMPAQKILFSRGIFFP